MERSKPGRRGQGRRECPGPVLKGFVKGEERGISVVHLHPRVAVASAIWDERHTTTFPFLLPKCMPRGELPSIWSLLKKKKKS